MVKNAKTIANLTAVNVPNVQIFAKASVAIVQKSN